MITQEIRPDKMAAPNMKTTFAQTTLSWQFQTSQFPNGSPNDRVHSKETAKVTKQAELYREGSKFLPRNIVTRLSQKALTDDQCSAYIMYTNVQRHTNVRYSVIMHGVIHAGSSKGKTDHRMTKIESRGTQI